MGSHSAGDTALVRGWVRVGQESWDETAIISESGEVLYIYIYDTHTHIYIYTYTLYIYIYAKRHLCDLLYNVNIYKIDS